MVLGDQEETQRKQKSVFVIFFLGKWRNPRQHESPDLKHVYMILAVSERKWRYAH